MKQTDVSISAKGYWNGNIKTEAVLEKALDFYGEEKLNEICKDEFEIWKMSDDYTSVNCDTEDLTFSFKSRKDAKEFVKNCVRPAEGYNDSLDIFGKRNIYADFRAIDDDAPFEKGQYMSDGMYYGGR